MQTLMNLMRDATNNQEAQAQMLDVLLTVAKRSSNPPGVMELAKLGNVSDASASRCVALLGRGLRAYPGSKLIETREDPMNYSRKLVHLTPKGERLMAALGDALIDALKRIKTS